MDQVLLPNIMGELEHIEGFEGQGHRSKSQKENDPFWQRMPATD